VPSLPQPSSDSVSTASAPVRTRPASTWVLFALVLSSLLIVVALKAPFRARLFSALLVTLGFALLAKLVRGVTYTGAAAGVLVTSLTLISCGWSMFAAVFLVFGLTLAATKFGRTRKQSLTIAERSGGRDGAQVLANVGVAGMFAALSAITPNRLPLIDGSLAALAEAACDTVSSETGKALALKPRLITSGKVVPAGTDGGISFAGTVLGAVAAALVALEAAVTGLLHTRLAIIVAASGLFGMFLDSLLGATLEQQRRLTNNTVNLLSTLASALLATILAW